MSLKTVIIITGPTASGKTELAIQIARHFHTSIISADSRQCYRELHIGVAKPSRKQLEETHHYFIDSHSIHEEVNAAVFEKLALEAANEVFLSQDVVVMSGGTGLYIKAFSEGLDDIPVIDPGVRERIMRIYQEKGIAGLRDLIQEADPLYFQMGETSNPQRLMRALEVVQSTGQSIVSFRNKEKKQRSFRLLEFGIRLPRKMLYQRINERVDSMMDQGLLDEAKSLLADQHLNALQTVGYSELFQYLQGNMTLEAAITLIKQNTRHYAKRQTTWMKKNKNLVWLEDNFLDQILSAYSSFRS